MTDEQIPLRGGFFTTDPRLDALPSYDERNRNFPVTAVVEATAPRSYTWALGISNLNQGREGACTGFATAHDLAARPVAISGVTADLARRLYLRAKQIDEWPGEDYEGSSVLAAVKAAKELGYYGEYRWAFGESDLALGVGYKGPAILAVPWFEGMYNTNANGFIRPTGQVAGWHAILTNGIRVTGEGYYILSNSWGSSWGQMGEAKISRADMRTLLTRGGTACIPVQRLRP